ncbi:MAG TPA: erythromycin esterase family protein [Asticcacaulis sp.]|nr:erythromycin esterase family protein [Asticcacaulis sp.]
MRFHDRADAGRQLARQLGAFRNYPDTIILALPRGGVPVAFEVAKALNLPLDVFLVRKLGHPGQPELAMGAIASGGLRVMNDEVLKTWPVDDAAINAVATREEAELVRREHAYRGDRPLPALRGKTVIVIDDGLATGASMAAALKALRLESPKALIAAFPVAPKIEDNELPDADEVFCVMRPDRFSSVGLWYERFDQTSDEEATALLKKAAAFGPHRHRTPEDRLAEKLNRHVTALTGHAEDYNELLLMARDARFVLIGEASHGTAEFYRIRAAITQRLIEEQGFMAVAVEADWPDAFRINRYVRGNKRILSADDALADFRRFPTWMWRNTEVRAFIDWLHALNEARAEEPVGFYGLDLYSLNNSMEAVIAYLKTVDPEAAERARRRYGCFEPFSNDPQLYGYMTARGRAGCEDAIVAQMRELQARTHDFLQKDGALAGEEFFSAEQNARLVANAESYYRAMFRGRPNSWNIRDTHMADTLDELSDFLTHKHGRPAKIVVWAHNSHIGDARATDAGAHGEVNIGQLTRQRHPGETLLIGFSTHGGQVTAAQDWDEPEENRQVRPALVGSIEDVFHRIEVRDFLLNLRDSDEVRDLLAPPRLERFIGVIYRPDTERQSHYFEVKLAQEFDAILHLDVTGALTPLDPSPHWHGLVHAAEETWPTGL